jgi:glycosyltransferase involved in cell wall biosynthesis
MSIATKTILVVAPYFPPHSGGLERYANEVSKRLVEGCGCRVVVLTTSETSEEVTEERDGLTIYRLRYTHKVSNTSFALHWFRRVPQLLATIRPDLIDIHMPVPGLGDVVALYAKKTPIVLHYHAGTMKKGKPFLDVLISVYERGVLPFLLRKAKHIICSSDFVRFGIMGAYVRKSSVINPATDPEVFTPRYDQSPYERTIVFVNGLGRGEGHKGFRTVLRALPALHRDVPEVRLMVVGEGDMRVEYEAEAESLGVRELISFVGKREGDGMAEVYRAGYVFALPTTNDSFPTVILEAMAAGLPVVSTQVGSIPTMVEHGETGYVTPANDRMGFVDHLRYVLMNPEHAAVLGRAGREKILHGYDWGTRARAHYAVYEAVLQNKPPATHVVGYYPPHVGGMEVVAEELAHELAARGREVSVVTSTIGRGGTPRTTKDTRLVVRRLPSVEFAHTPFLAGLLCTLLFLPARTRMHVHIAQAGLPEIALLAARVRKFPYIAHFHLDVEPSGFLGPLFLWYKKYVLGYVLRHANRIIVFSAEQAALVVEKYAVLPRDVVVIPNGVNRVYIDTHVRTWEGEAPLNLLSVGRLANQKRIDRIIEAVGLLTVPVHLTVVGDGEDRAMLEELAARVAPGRVTFVGRKTPEEVRAFQRAATVFVLPSDKEGMPLSALEAMAAGLPIIGSNVLGIRELIRDVGVLVDPTPRGFADAITALVQHPTGIPELSQKSMRHAQRYGWESVVTRLEEVYASL